MSESPNLAVGSLVIARRTTGVCDAGERGVCYEAYTLPDEKGGRRPGWSFLFEQGRYDGFSPDEVKLILEITGEICPAVADYPFQNVMRLRGCLKTKPLIYMTVNLASSRFLAGQAG